MSLALKQPKSTLEYRVRPSNTTLQILVKSIEQSLRLEGYHVSSQLIQERLEAHF
jgi:hypothetical protein